MKRQSEIAALRSAIWSIIAQSAVPREVKAIFGAGKIAARCLAPIFGEVRRAAFTVRRTYKHEEEISSAVQLQG